MLEDKLWIPKDRICDTLSENSAVGGMFFSRLIHKCQDFWNAMKGIITRSWTFDPENSKKVFERFEKHDIIK